MFALLFPCSGPAQSVEASLNVGAQPCAVAVNIFTNQIVEANCLGNTVGVISGTNNIVTPVTVGNSPAALAINPVTNKIYVANSGSNTVSVIDGITYKTSTVSVGANPRALAVNEVTGRVYVANNSDSTVTVIEGLAFNTRTLNVGANPIAVAINPVTDQIYVANLGGTVTIIDGANNHTTTVPVGVFPQALAVNPVTNQIYVANSDSNTLTVIDGATRHCTTLNVGLFPVAVAVNPALNQIYVADKLSLDLMIIDGVTGHATTVSLGDNPNALAVNVSTNQIYVASTKGIVTVVDGATQALATVPVGAYPSAVAVNPLTNRVYTADSNSNTVTAIDADTNQSTTVALGANPQGVATDPVTNLIYALNADDNTVSVIDGASGQTATISVGTKPTGLAVNSGSNQIFITNNMSDTATVIDGLTTEVNTLNVGINPAAVAVNPVTNRAYIANSGESTVTEIEGTTGQTTTLKVGKNPSAIAVNPATDTIYVANATDGTVTVIDGVSGRSVAVTVGMTPNAIAVNPVTNQIYIANSGSNSVSVIDGATNLTTNVPVGTTPVAVAVNPITNRIFVANSGSGTVTVIRGSTNATATVKVGSTPVAVAANPVTNHIYVANAGSNTVTVIDGMSNQTTTVPAGTNPSALSINPSTGQIYVTNSASNNVTVIAEQRAGVLPLTTAIAALPGNVTVERTPTFILSATGSYAPTNPPILGIRYQADTWDGAWQPAIASGSGFNANLPPLQLGPHVLYAVAENGQAAASTGLDQNLVGSISAYFFTVVQGQTTTEANSSANPSLEGQSVTLTASVQAVAPASGGPTGSVRFFDGATMLASAVPLNGSGLASLITSSLAPGTHTITARYVGDVNFASSTSNPTSQVVAQDQVLATVTSRLNPSAFGQGVILNALVQPVAPASGVPTGTVTFFDGSTILGSPVGLDGNGQAGFAFSTLAPGTHSITASYSGDTNFASGASSPLNQLVAKGQMVATLTSNLTTSTFGQGVTLTATVQPVSPATGTPTGTVTFFDGSVALGNGGALNGSGLASFTTSSLIPGAHSITASYNGDTNFAGGASTSLNQLVDKGQTVATLTSNLDNSIFGQGVTLTASVRAVAPATGTPTGTVTFFDGNLALGSGAVLHGSGLASFTTASLAPGTHAITANYTGDMNFAGSTSSVVNNTVNSPQIALALSKDSLTVSQGGTGSLEIDISSNGALLAPVTFACTGLPANATCKFSPSVLSPSALPGKVTVTVGATTIAGVIRPRQGLGGGLWYGFAVIGIVFGGCELRRPHRTKLRLGGVTSLLLIIITVGCGSGGKAPGTASAATPSISTVAITATSGSFRATANISLTVMP